jgi:hypothetical protein
MSKRPDAFARLANVLESQRETTDGAPALPAEIVPGTDAELSTSEQQALSHYEQIIERGLKTFFEVGTALAQVRDLRLYRTEYRTFEEYSSERWGMGRTHADRLIGAAAVYVNLAPIGVKTPANEAQIRPLTRLDPEQQREAWQAALERANETGKRITAALVEAVVNELQPRPAAPLPLTDTEGEVPAPAAAPEAQIIDLQPEPAPPAPALDDQADDDDDDGEQQVGTGGDWPDDLGELRRRLAGQGYVLFAETESRLTYQNHTTGDVIRIVKPPEPGQVKVRIVANASDDWSDVAERLALVGVDLDRPRAGHLPKYPETQRAYGTLDLGIEQLDDVAELRREVQRLQGENAVAHRWYAAIQGLLKENEHLRQQADQRAAYNSRSPLAIYVNELLGILDEIEDVLGGGHRP